MTAAAWMAVAATLGMVALALAAVLTLVDPGHTPRRVLLVDVILGGLFAALVAVVTVAYIGARLS